MTARRPQRTGLSLVALVLLAGMGGALASEALALPPAIDGDQDGHVDAIETALGSDPGDQTKTPESVAVAGSCFDGEDNDGDGDTDDADVDVLGCRVPEPVEDTFPPAGTDVFDSSLTLDGYDFSLGGGVICRIDFDASGPVVVTRSTPTGTPAVIDVEIIAMQLSGMATVLTTGSVNCPVPSGTFGVTIVERGDQNSNGQVTDNDGGDAVNFPADSFFDVFFDAVVSLGDADFVLPGGPPGGPPGDPVRVTNTINTLPPYHGGQNPLCYEVAGLPHEHCPKAPPDHYLCYKAKFSPKFDKRDVTLVDQFDDGGAGTQAQVLKPTLFCTPAAKNGEPLYEKTGHLKCYKLKAQKVKRDVFVRNQFGQKAVETKKATLLCLPTEKNDEGEPQELDHFKCYTGKFPKFQKRDVTLVDQFGTVETKVVKPQMLCNPVSKDGGVIANPLNHLECYKLKPRKVKQTVAATNQFGDETVSTKKAVMVCLPSGKNEVVSTTTTTTTTVPDTTTTTIPTGVTVTLGYIHTNPGVSSTLCGRVSAPSMPNASGNVSIEGPQPSNPPQTTVSLNGNGVGQFQVTIFVFGTYTVDVQVGSLMGTESIDVVSNAPGCP